MSTVENEIKKDYHILRPNIDSPQDTSLANSMWNDSRERFGKIYDLTNTRHASEQFGINPLTMDSPKEASFINNFWSDIKNRFRSVIDSMNSALATKADITYVDIGLDTKSDTTYVNNELATKADIVTQQRQVANQFKLNPLN